MRALEIDGSLAGARAALGYAILYYDWDWDGAEREFRRAIELSPNYPTAHQYYAMHLVWVGRLDEAIARVRAGAGARSAVADHQRFAWTMRTT